MKKAKSKNEKLKNIHGDCEDAGIAHNKPDKVYFAKKLKESNYNITSQRWAILEVLFDNIKYVMSVEDIAKKVKKLENSANLTTVYRNLEVFEKIGIVRKTVLENNVSFYKICFQSHHHHHFICKLCHKIIDFEFCPITDVTNLAETIDFDIDYHNFEVIGMCVDCRKNI